MEFRRIAKSWLLIALGVFIASNTSSGIHYSSSASLLVAVVLLSGLNVFLKPLLMLFSLPFIILTFGLGIWIINALLFLLVGNLVAGFEVDTFTNALWGAFVVSVTGCIANLLFGKPGENRRVHVNISGSRNSTHANRQNEGKRVSSLKDDDVIDI